MSPILHYCNTNYITFPPTDINPLLLIKYSQSMILVLCAREGQTKRIRTTIQQNPKLNLVCCGWWETSELGITNWQEQPIYSELYKYDVVIILDKNRIDSRFKEKVKWIEHACTPYTPPKTQAKA